MIKTEREDLVMVKRSLVSVVDDDQPVRELLPDLLRQFGFDAHAGGLALTVTRDVVFSRRALRPKGVPLLSAAAAVAADGRLTTLAARTNSPERRVDVDESTRTTVTAKMMAPIRNVKRRFDRSNGLIGMPPCR